MRGSAPLVRERLRLSGRARRLVVAGAWLAVVGGLVLWAWLEGLGPAEAATRLVDALEGSAWGPVVFVAAYLTRPLFLFSAAILTVAGGFLYGPALGLALVAVASAGSAMVAYALARWLGAGFRPDPAAAGRAARWAGRMRDRSFESVLVMRLLLLPFDLVSYLAGAIRAHPLAFLAATVIGSAPATVAFVLFGASLESFDGGVPSIDVPVLVASVFTLVAGLGLAEALRRRERGA
jgi:uncharacterized membrane protein YdjX (TVP38/TMEM64 family)